MNKKGVLIAGVVIMVCFVAVGSALAQEREHPGMGRRAQTRERIETLKTLQMMDALSLGKQRI